ncbi:serine hydrolase [Clostridium sp. 19966]|uniref:serine hydrolase domain-containing protein n=1 Tax=Clostridium sp. 19966 TaxID=2768166 RepID=UPI0028DFF550|nr:serine hydrolase [Clostridium sp. 19966]MDT8718341.1 serine hydrolase [Clostridium sp. 19966]
MEYEKFDDIVDKNFSGVIAIRKADKEVYKKAYGYADKSNKITNKINTSFAMASGSKVFTAVSILQLVEKGLLSLDSALGDIVDFNLNLIDDNITVHQLLNHTSGIPDYFNEEIMEEYDELWVDYPMYKIRKSSAIMPLFIDKPMQYGRGSKFKYNNSGYVMLGLIIEKISGRAFDEYVQENIFKPCNMLGSGYFEFDRMPGNCANSYIYDKTEDSFRTNIYSVDVKGTGAGGAFSTVDDMMSFWQCLLEYKLLSKETTKEMLSPKAGDDSSLYGYGVWLKKNKQDGYIYYLMGSDPGVSFNSFVEEASNIKAVIMSNENCNVWKYNRNIAY